MTGEPRDEWHPEIKDSPEAIAFLGDKQRYRAIIEGAAADVGMDYKVGAIPDLPLKIALARAFLKLPARPYSAGLIGNVLFGGYADKSGGPKMTRIQQGGQLSRENASMLVQFFNYFLDAPISPTGRSRLDLVADIGEWIEQRLSLNWRLTASDLSGDMMSFCRRLHAAITLRAIESQKTRRPGQASDPFSHEFADSKLFQQVHTQAMAALFAPLGRASWDSRLIIQDRRPEDGVRNDRRFGAEQRSRSHPATWTPTEIASQEYVLEYGMAKRATRALRAWLVTVRDPAWINIDGDLAPDRWLWTQNWDRIIRALPPFLIAAGDELAAPTSDANKVVMYPGLYRVFLICEPDDGVNAISHSFWPDGDEPADRIPNETAFLQLCDQIQDDELPERIEVYTGAYFIPG